MVETLTLKTIDKQLVEKVASAYNWLDLQIQNNCENAGSCDACGKCCDFDSYDHRLFITTPELMYLVANIGAEKIKQMTTSRCPYNIADKCTVYKYRFTGCRIFSCKGNSDFQGQLSESVSRRFKSICTDLQIPYRYTDLATALNHFNIQYLSTGNGIVS